MDIHEIQIDDYVMFDGSVYQVEEISKKGWVHLAQDGNRVSLSSDYILSCLEGVHLTSEILEKNGFEKALQLSDTKPFDTDEEGNKHYSYNKTFWGWWQPDNIFCIPANGLGWLNIKFVHQLQHALKLCGIEKEIIIKK